MNSEKKNINGAHFIEQWNIFRLGVNTVLLQKGNFRTLLSIFDTKSSNPIFKN